MFPGVCLGRQRPNSHHGEQACCGILRSPYRGNLCFWCNTESAKMRWFLTRPRKHENHHAENYSMSRKSVYAHVVRDDGVLSRFLEQFVDGNVILSGDLWQVHPWRRVIYASLSGPHWSSNLYIKGNSSGNRLHRRMHFRLLKSPLAVQRQKKEEDNIAHLAEATKVSRQPLLRQL